MKNVLDEDIKKGEFSTVYLLYGEEEFLKQSYKKQLRSAIAGDDTMNLNIFTGRDIDVREIINLSETMPFFADRRLILVEDSGFFKKGQEELAEYLDYCSALICRIMDLEGDDAKALKLVPVSARKGTGVQELTEMIRTDLLVKGPEIMERSVGLKLLQILNQTRSQIASYREVLKMAPNVFNRRFEEMKNLMVEQRQQVQHLEGRKYLRAEVNEEKAFLTRKVRDLFGIEYYYFVDREDAAELMDREEYAAELTAVYDELEDTVNSIFMYKEENAYTVARRIEDLNILMQQMRKLSRQIEREIQTT